MDIKANADNKVLINSKLLENESYFDKLMMQMVLNGFISTKVPLNPDAAKYINGCLVKEYINEYQGKYAW